MFSRRKSEKQNQVRWHILCNNTECWVAELGITVDLEQSLWKFTAEDTDSVHSLTCSRQNICPSVSVCKREDRGPPGSQSPQAGQRKVSRRGGSPIPWQPRPRAWILINGFYLVPETQEPPPPFPRFWTSILRYSWHHLEAQTWGLLLLLLPEAQVPSASPAPGPVP